MQFRAHTTHTADKQRREAGTGKVKGKQRVQAQAGKQQGKRHSKKRQGGAKKIKAERENRPATPLAGTGAIAARREGEGRGVFVDPY